MNTYMFSFYAYCDSNYPSKAIVYATSENHARNLFYNEYECFHLISVKEITE